MFIILYKSNYKNATGSKLAGGGKPKKWVSTGAHQMLPTSYGNTIPMTYIAYGNGGIWVAGTYPEGAILEPSVIQGMIGLGVTYTSN